MRAGDMRVRQELLDSGELGGSYVPRMEEMHSRNASRLRELIAVHGWPDETIAGKDGAEAAWFIVQHAIAEPEFSGRCCAFCLLAGARNAYRHGTQRIWKIGFQCTKAGRRPRVRSGWMIRVTAEFGPGGWRTPIRLTSCAQALVSDRFTLSRNPARTCRWGSNEKLSPTGSGGSTG